MPKLNISTTVTSEADLQEIEIEIARARKQLQAAPVVGPKIVVGGLYKSISGRLWVVTEYNQANKGLATMLYVKPISYDTAYTGELLHVLVNNDGTIHDGKSWDRVMITTSEVCK